MNAKELVDQILPALRGFVARNLEAMAARVKALEDRPPVPGPAGEKGEPGVVGEKGVDGAPGADGAAGLNGKDGVDGANGIDGEAGDQGLRGEKGDPGSKGDPGEPGLPGEKGADGQEGLPGDSGERGEPGPAGVKGDPGESGKDGAAGEKGADGAPGASGDVGPAGPAGERGEKGDPGAAGPAGEKGDSGEPGQAGEVGSAGARGEKGDPGPAGPQGEHGEQGPVGPAGAKGADGIHGKDIDPLVVEAMVIKAVSEIPKPQDGRDGMPGERGADAFAIEVLPGIDSAKRYQRGIWAKHDGGLWCSRKATDGMEGWECIVDGIKAVEAVQDPDDPRKFALGWKMSSGARGGIEMRMPVPLYRGIWKEGDLYERGDSTTRDGCTWILMTERQMGSPGETGVETGWQMAVKRGRDGARGEQGKSGNSGKDGKEVVVRTGF